MEDATDATFDELRLEGTNVYDRVFDGCTFRRCHFEQVVFNGCRFTDCRFEASDLIGVRFVDTSLIDVGFRGGRAMGVDWSELRRLTLGIRFDGVRLDYSNFAELPLSGTRFHDCSLRDAVFSGADLRRADFRGSELVGARLDDSDLRGTDLREALGVVFDPRRAKLGKTRVNGVTAVALLEVLGLEVSEVGSGGR